MAEEELEESPDRMPPDEEEGAEENRIEIMPEETDETVSEPGEDTEAADLSESLTQINDKYLRLYADFENYKKLTAKNRKDLLTYASEGLMGELLTVIDHLELALRHASEDTDAASLTEGVEMTLKELRSILQKHGLSPIETVNRPFDPNVHHAMSQIDSAAADENTVLEEFRKGYMYKDRVLRAALVGVSKKPAGDQEPSETREEET